MELEHCFYLQYISQAGLTYSDVYCVCPNLILCSDGERVLLEELSDLKHIQLQELVQLVDVCEVLVDKVVRRHLQLRAVQALSKSADA